MPPESRITLLRERAARNGAVKKAAPAGLHRSQHPEMDARPVRVRWVVLPKPTGRGYVSCGPMQSRTPPVWVATPDVEPELAPTHKRRTGVPALVKIAAKLLRKPKRGEATSEHAWSWTAPARAIEGEESNGGGAADARDPTGAATALDAEADWGAAPLLSVSEERS